MKLEPTLFKDAERAVVVLGNVGVQRTPLLARCGVPLFERRDDFTEPFGDGDRSKRLVDRAVDRVTRRDHTVDALVP